MAAMQPPCCIRDIDVNLDDVLGLLRHLAARFRDVHRCYSESVDVPPKAEVVELARSVHEGGVGSSSPRGRRCDGVTSHGGSRCGRSRPTSRSCARWATIVSRPRSIRTP